MNLEISEREFSMVLCYDGTDIRMHRFVDSDFASDVYSQRSTARYIFTLESGLVSWVLRLQKIVNLSMTEA